MDLFKRIQDLSAIYDDDGPSSTVLESRPMFNDGGMLVQPSVDGSRPGYNGDRKTVHLVRETGNPNHSGIYKTTNTKTGSVSYRGQFNRRNEGGFKATPSRSTIKQARIDLNEAMKNIPKGKSIIELQKERGAGNLLNDKKFINQLEKAFEEISNLEKKGYGNIDNIVKKYQKKFYKKVGTKNIDGSTVKKGTDNVFTKTLAKEIREYAKDLNIYGIENPNMEKALNDYRRIKNPKRGMIGNIANRYNIDFKTFDRYITKLGQRKYIPTQDPGEYTKAIRDAEKKAIKKFSDRYFERVLSAPMTSGKFFADAADDDVVRLQKSHLGDKLTQDVKTSNIGYAAQEINQEVLKEVDTEMRQLNKKLANLYKNKPEGYLKEMDRLNQRGNDLAAATKGYKKFTGIDPYTGKEFTINFSSPSQELDPTELLGEDTKLADIDKQNKATVKNLKATAMKNASKTKTQVQADIKEIKSLIAGLGGGDCGRGFKNQGGRIGLKDGPVNVDVCFKNGLERVKKGGVDFTKAESNNFSKLTKGIKAMGASNIMKLGVIPEALFEGALIADKMASEGDSFMQGVRNSYLAIPFQAMGMMDTYEEGRRKEILNPELINKDAAPLGEMQKKQVQDVFNMQDSLNRKNQLRQEMFNLQEQKKQTDAISDGSFGYVGDTQDLNNRILKRRQELEGLYDDPSSKLGKVSRDEKLLTRKPMDLDIKDQLTMDAYNQAVEKANALRAGNILFAPGTGLEDVQIKKRMKELPVTPKYAKEQLQATGDFFGTGYTPLSMNRLFKLMGRQDPEFGIEKVGPRTGEYNETKALNDYINYLRTSQFADNFREEKAGGGISGLSGGDRSGAMTRSMNPDSQGLSYLFNRVKKV